MLAETLAWERRFQLQKHLDKLAVAHLAFSQHKMLDGPLVPPRLIPEAVDPGGVESDDENSGAVDGNGATYDVQLARRPHAVAFSANDWPANVSFPH